MGLNAGRWLRRVGRARATWIPAALMLSAAADAHSGIPTGRARPSSTAAQSNAEQPHPSLSARLGFGREHAQLEEGGAARGRALRRLSLVAPNQAYEAARLLDVWLESEPLLDSTEQLALARTLAPLASQSAAKRRLREFLTNDGSNATTDPQFEMARRIVMLGLARSGDSAALELLGQWLRREPQLAQLAADAIIAYPPVQLDPLLAAAGPTTPLLLQALAKLGDVRAATFVRRTLKRATPDVQAQAALTLAALGDRETINVAHYWLDAKGVAVDLLAAASEILLKFDASRQREAFQALLSRSPEQALSVAARYPRPAVSILGDALDSYSDLETQKRALKALAQAGSAGVEPVVRALLESPSLRGDAAFLLGHSKQSAAYAALLDAVRVAELRPTALRALVLQQIYNQRTMPELHGLLEQLLAEGSVADQAIARWGLASIDPQRALRLLASRRLANLEAAASVFWLHDDAYRRACVGRLIALSRQPLAAETLALSPALSAPEISSTVPVSLLVAWIHSGLPVAIAAAWQLATRAVPEQQPLIDRLLAAPDNDVRAAAYLGLGLNTRPEYTGVLTRALFTELDPSVRVSIVSALRFRPRTHTSDLVLRFTRDYDPSGAVRQAAGERQRRVSEIDSPAELSGSAESIWLDLVGGEQDRTTIAFLSATQSPVVVQASQVTAMTMLGLSTAGTRLRLHSYPLPQR